MCIVLLTTTHPDYALVMIDNRDEFILRPTSRPEWWTHQAGHKVLSARDMQRAEKGTWLGITKEGSFAVLTNYRETNLNDINHPVHAKRSRGGMVTAWLGTRANENVNSALERLIADGVQGVGGFSMVCGKLRRTGPRRVQPLGIVSNRCDHVDHVSWICEERDKVYGLSNTAYGDPDEWRKIEQGKLLLRQATAEAYANKLSEDEFCDKLFTVLDQDTLPRRDGASLMDMVESLRESIFIPAIGDEEHRRAAETIRSQGRGEWASASEKAAEEVLKAHGRPESLLGFDTGMYGTQRQTIVLVDWDGNVTFKERALWDANGNAIPRGQADVVHKFSIEGWQDEMEE
ncbi:hypothetical protein TD95_003647 [Thielaviopsis punctulata]|uniref:Transport and Golgi organization protein 2 n=1 Tax=Thielaviopsis punctulata TaxID=72032 RepID=A0A0F4Z750_9PEZI|nr:hypothetical protein TD95_003647 [Thielaviopsis punctulata]